MLISSVFVWHKKKFLLQKPQYVQYIALQEHYMLLFLASSDLSAIKKS